jgi:hypothetical protein
LRSLTAAQSCGGAAKLLREKEAMRDHFTPRREAPEQESIWSLFNHLETNDMKTLCVAVSAFFAVQGILCAQFLTPDPGFNSQLLFQDSSGDNISAIGTDSFGNIFYLETGVYSGTLQTELFERTAASHYAAPAAPLYSFGTPDYGNYAKVNGSTVYFGESTNYTVNSIGVNGTGETNIATINYNYDIAFSGSQVFIDYANSSFSNNTIALLNTANGSLSPVVVTGGASGPLAFLSNGNLIYGGSAFGEPGAIYEFTKAQIDGVLNGTVNGGQPLTLSQGTELFNNGGNQYLAALNNTDLYQVFSNYATSVNLINYYNLTLGTSETVGSIDGIDDGDIFSGLAPLGGGVAVAVSADFGAGPSAVFLVTPTPEPSAMALLAGACLWFAGGRFRRRAL